MRICERPAPAPPPLYPAAAAAVTWTPDGHTALAPAFSGPLTPPCAEMQGAALLLRQAPAAAL